MRNLFERVCPGFCWNFYICVFPLLTFSPKEGRFPSETLWHWFSFWAETWLTLLYKVLQKQLKNTQIFSTVIEGVAPFTSRRIFYNVRLKMSETDKSSQILGYGTSCCSKVCFHNFILISNTEQQDWYGNSLNMLPLCTKMQQFSAQAALICPSFTEIM